MKVIMSSTPHVTKFLLLVKPTLMPYLLLLLSKSTTQLEPEFCIISKWFIGNVIPGGGREDFLHPFQPFFTYSLPYYRLETEIGVHYLESMLVATLSLLSLNLL